jgi:hypothetical protein
MNRQEHFHTRPQADAALDEYRSTQALDDATRAGETQARALSGGLGGEEGLEDVRQRRLGHALSGVSHGKTHVGARRELPGPNCRPIDDDCSGLDDNAALRGDCFAAVEEEVHQDLLHLQAVGFDRW